MTVDRDHVSSTFFVAEVASVQNVGLYRIYLRTHDTSSCINIIHMSEIW